MTLGHAEGECLARDGMAALRRGDAQTAYRLLMPLRQGITGMPVPWLLIAQAARASGDDLASEDALGHHLAAEPRHLGALLLMAGTKVSRGDERAAQSFYRTALAIASQAGTDIAPALVPLLRTGEAFLASSTARFTAHFDALIGQLGLTGMNTTPRLQSAIDLLLGKSELYLQQPSMFYFPGLAQRPFFERDEFEWLAPVEAATASMREECLAVGAASEGFTPYVRSTSDRPPPANPLRDDPSWGAFYLWQSGQPVAANAERCPATMAALEHAPMPLIKGRSPMAIYSLLKPGTHIAAHHGLLNTRLICHVPLIAPDDCELRVGAEKRRWRQGETLIFDDSIEHEAWNRGSETRIVLLFEIWRPEIDADERAALTTIFEAIDQYQGPVADVG